MARPDNGPVVLSAQDLRDGRVVYWTGIGWSDAIADASVARSEEAVRALHAQAGRANAGTQVIDAFMVAIVDDTSGPRPAHHREALRAAGPSIAFGPGALTEAA